MIPKVEPETLYDILGVPETATEEDIRIAYFQLVRAFRPKEDPLRYQRLNEARETLLDKRRRGEYDQVRRSGARVRVLLDQAALSLDRDPQKTLGLLKSAVAMAPDMVRPRMLLTQLLMRNKQYDIAERQYKWLLAVTPNDEYLRCRLANCLALQGRLEEAEYQLKETLRINLAYHDAMLLLARLYRDAGRTPELIAMLEAAIQSDGLENFADFNALLQLLLVYVQTNNILLIQETAQRLLTVIPESKVVVAAEAFVRSTFLLMDMEQYSLALGVLKNVLPITERLSEESSELRLQLLGLVSQIELAQESVQLDQDDLLAGALQECFRVIYRDRSAEQIRQSRMEAAFADLQREFEVDARSLIKKIDYARREYPNLCIDQETFLEQLRQRCVRRIEQQVAAAAASASQSMATEATPTVETGKGGFLKRLFNGTRRAA